MERILVGRAETGERIDTYLAHKTSMTRSQVQKLIDGGRVLVNGVAVRHNYRVREGDAVAVEPSREEADELIPEALPVEVLYQDEAVVVVNKPAGMVVYPAAGNRHGTLMNALAYRCGKLAAVGGPLRPGVVHRLDKDTSGVMVTAVSDKAYYDLVGQFRQRTIARRYIVLVHGNLKGESGEISAAIGRSVSDRKKMSTRTRRGKEAVTRWRVIERFGCATLIEARLGTGRTHQIRVHFSSVGHPVLGDRTYGKKIEIEVKHKRIPVPRQMLHAAMLGFRHPISHSYVEFSSPLPEDMEGVIDSLRHETGRPSPAS